MEARLTNRRTRVWLWCSTAPGSQREPMTQSASLISFTSRERPAAGGAVGIHVPDQVGQRGQLEPFDQRAALADGSGKFERGNRPGAFPPTRRTTPMVLSRQPLSTTVS